MDNNNFHQFDPIPDPELQAIMDIIQENRMLKEILENGTIEAAVDYVYNPFTNSEPPEPNSVTQNSTFEIGSSSGTKRSAETTTLEIPQAKKPKRPYRQETWDTTMSINGIDLDISGIPRPVCSCTGTPRKCNRWGNFGWQSTCCTNKISGFPLPIGNNRRGTRIVGRKMTIRVFKMILEQALSEGHDLSIPIDLKLHWATRGSNQFQIFKQRYEFPATS